MSRGRLLPQAWRAVRSRSARRRRSSRRFPLLPRRERFRRGIYILPSLFTVANLFCGFYAVVLAINGDFRQAALFLGVAIFFDSLDGKVARLTQTTSDFGVELDSLCDVISFGVAPAVLAYTWTLNQTGRAGWLVAFIYIVSGASRLARFNVQTLVLESKDFVGLPIPAGAAAIASLVYAAVEPPSHPAFPWIVLGLMGCIALLQVSTIRYPSFKRMEWTRSRHYGVIVAIAAIMAFVAYHPAAFLLALAYIYLLSGPVGRILFKRSFVERVAEVSPSPAQPADREQGVPEPTATDSGGEE